MNPMIDTSLTDQVSSQVSEYYSDKIRQYGPTPQGVDWNGEHSQTTRFGQLSKLFEQPDDLANRTVVDLGCGYGAYYEFLVAQGHRNFKYVGYDLSPEMCDSALGRIGDHQNVEIFHTAEIKNECDFAVASGIFSVKVEQDDASWLAHIHRVLQHMNQRCRTGFAFNCLTSYSDAEKMREHLYYANPMQMFDYCKTHFSKNVALLHDYDLYEFTILVRKG